jgi:ubiquinone/menaquinone biosynthesis C-methylase UbiE
MITMIGEIPAPGEAMHEFHRVLRHGGTRAFSEFITYPDYSLPRTLNALASEAGFRLNSRLGKLSNYTLIFEKREEG